MTTWSGGGLSLDLSTRPRYLLGRSLVAGVVGIAFIVWAAGDGAESAVDKVGAGGVGAALVAAALWWLGRLLGGWRRATLTIDRAGVGYRGTTIGWSELSSVGLVAVNPEHSPVGYLVLCPPDPDFGARHPALRTHYFPPDDTFRVELGAGPDTLDRVHAALATFAGSRYRGPIDRVDPAGLAHPAGVAHPAGLVDPAGRAPEPPEPSEPPGRPLGELRVKLPGQSRSGLLIGGLLCLAFGGAGILGGLTGRIEGAPPIAGVLVGALFALLGAASLTTLGGKKHWWLLVGPAGVRLEGGGGFTVRWDELAAVHLYQRRGRDRYGRVPPQGLLALLPADPGFADRHPEMSALRGSDGVYAVELGQRPDVSGQLDQALRLLAGGRYAGIQDKWRGLELT